MAEYTHFTNLAFTTLFAKGEQGQEVQIISSGSQLTPPDGTAAAPGLAFALDLDTGVYRPSADSIGWSCGGSRRLQLDANSLQAFVAMQGQDGSVSTPGFGFKDDTDTGMYRIAANDLGIACGGVLVFRIDSSGDCTIGRNTSSVFKLVGVTASAGSNAGSIGNRPDSAAGNSPATWLAVSINGTLRYIPAW